MGCFVELFLYSLFMSFFIYSFPFVFKFLLLTCAYKLEISRSSHRDSVSDNNVSCKTRSFCKELTKGLQLYWKLAPWEWLLRF